MNNGVVKETDFEIETCLYEIIFDKQPNRLIGVIYRHPSRNDMKSVEHIKSTIEKIKKENKKTLLVGDFNYNLLVHDKNATISAFLNMIFENNFQPCILGPTRIVDGNNPSLLDNIFSNSIENTINGNLFDKITDHMPNFVIIENIKTSAKRRPIKRRDLKNFDKNKFQAELLDSIPEIENVDNAEDAYILFHEKYLSILDVHAPYQLLNKKEQELEQKP